MQETHLSNIDLNLLVTLQALLEERHVTRAAKRCFLSQSAMSRALERLRETFQDELLIRSGRGYERTVRGERLLRELESILPRIDAIVRGESFDPVQSQERFRISMTDFASVVLLPGLVQRLRASAPKVKLEIVAHHDNVFDDLESGKIDLAMEVSAFVSGLESQIIFEEDFVCLQCTSRPQRRKRMTIAEYLKFAHVVVNVRAGQQTLVDRPLADLGVQRQVALTVPYFVVAILAVSGTDSIVTVPRRLAKIVAPLQTVRAIEAPVELPKFNYMMAWHPRLTAEPAQQWLREQVQAVSSKV
ncbi:MAG TPA: LysR family transcriptional regulator [Alloacidobacterium sp.]|nr:LysR family transcriptional regulator [Alloacidobacterium sp.]